MYNSLKLLRPVGNPIVRTKNSLEDAPFAPLHTFFYHSGTASLAAAIIASHKLKPEIVNPEVIVPAYACPDLISAIIYAQAVPVLVDLEEYSPQMSLKKLSDAITDKTIAIVAVRFFGITEHDKTLSNIAKQHNLMLIEDSAQGFPAHNLSNYWGADFIILSFGRGKPVNLLGGGAVLTQNPQLYQLLPIPTPIQNSLINNIKYKVKLFIYNLSIQPFLYGLLTRTPGLSIGQTIYKPLNEINGISSATRVLLKSNLKAYRLRQNCQQKYNAMLQSCSRTDIINLPFELNHDMSQPLLRYPIVIKNTAARNRLYEKLKPYGASLMYKQPLHLIDKVDNLIKKQNNNNYPNATHFAQQLLTLPTHEGVDNKTLRIIESAIKAL